MVVGLTWFCFCFVSLLKPQGPVAHVGSGGQRGVRGEKDDVFGGGSQRRGADACHNPFTVSSLSPFAVAPSSPPSPHPHPPSRTHHADPHGRRLPPLPGGAPPRGRAPRRGRPPRAVVLLPAVRGRHGVQTDAQGCQGKSGRGVHWGRGGWRGTGAAPATPPREKNATPIKKTTLSWGAWPSPSLCGRVHLSLSTRTCRTHASEAEGGAPRRRGGREGGGEAQKRAARAAGNWEALEGGGGPNPPCPAIRAAAATARVHVAGQQRWAWGGGGGWGVRATERGGAASQARRAPRNAPRSRYPLPSSVPPPTGSRCRDHPHAPLLHHRL